MSTNWPWSVLGLKESPADLQDVRRAYAARLREIDVDTDIDGFQALRAAYAEGQRRVSGQSERPHNSFGTSSQVLSAFADRPADDEVPRLPRKKPDALPQTSFTHREGAALEQALSEASVSVETVEALFEAENFDVALWEPILFASREDELETSFRLEQRLVARLSGHPAKLGNIPHNWFMLVNRRFEWTADGVGFAHRYPHAQHVQQTISQLVLPNVSRKIIYPEGKPFSLLAALILAGFVYSLLFVLVTTIYI